MEKLYNIVFNINKNSMRIIFMGTPDFAVPSLHILVKNGFQIVGVVTVADKSAGRGQQVIQSPVKKYALEKKLPLLQPENLKDAFFLQELRELKADLQIVVAFRMLPEKVWNMPSLGTINLHASLLPQYRGAAPINWAIINGDKETGLSTFFLQHEIDMGRIIFQENIIIGENESAGELHDRMMHIGSQVVLKTVKSIEKGNYPKLDQINLLPGDEELKKAPKIFKEDCKINLSKSPDRVHDFIRGLSPYPGAWAEIESNRLEIFSLKIFKASKEIHAHNYKIGTVITDRQHFIKLACAGGLINILELQLPGKKKMSTVDFLRGVKTEIHWEAK